MKYFMIFLLYDIINIQFIKIFLFIYNKIHIYLSCKLYFTNLYEDKSQYKLMTDMEEYS
jgi:hypothetical protein